MSEDERIYSIVTLDNGEQIPVSSSSNVSITLLPMDAIVADTSIIDVTEEEFSDLQKMAETNDIPYDTIKAKEVSD